MVGKAQLRNDFRAQHAGDIRGSGNATARCDFLSDATAAHDFPTFEDERRQAGASQVSRGSEAVVPSADHNGVITCLHSDSDLIVFPLPRGGIIQNRSHAHEYGA